MSLYYEDSRSRLFLGDCRAVLERFDADTFDAVVTDPPYELGFMGRAWDGSGVAFDPDTWRAIIRVLKPGAHLVAFGAPRNYHRLAVAIEDAGFEIRDSLMWLFGSGFPKSRNIGDGWGTALKPAYEPIVLARKPLSGTVAANVLAHGTGGMNIDGCRIGTEPAFTDRPGRKSSGGLLNKIAESTVTSGGAGRWPANVVLDEAAAALLDAEVGLLTTYPGTMRRDAAIGGYNGVPGPKAGQVLSRGDSGGPSRFFYTAKASRAERERGLEGDSVRRSDGRAKDIENPRLRTSSRRNHHPTVKPVDLMRWLCRLITPPGGLILDPFVGSGSTRLAALAEGFESVGIDIDAEYLDLAAGRAAQAGLIGGLET